MEKTKREKLLISLKETGLTAQVHGIPRIIGNNRLILKLLWVFAFLGSASACFYFFQKSFNSYYDYPFITNINNVNENPMLFPTVTICSLRPPNKSYSLNDVIVQCTFNRLPCGDTDFVKIARQTQQLKPCYQFNSGYSNKPILNIKRGGLFNTLRVVLFEGLFDEPRTEILNQYYSNGFQVFIHNKSDFVSSDNGLIIQPGTSTFISLKKVVDTKLTEPYNDCIKDINTYHSFDSSLYKEIIESNFTYSQKYCLDYAFFKSVNCSISYDQFLAKCLDKLDYFIELYFKYYKNDDYLKNLNKCPLECDTIAFQSTVSSSYYPSYKQYKNLAANKKLISKFPNKENTTLDELRKSVYELHVYFENLKVTHISQEPKFGLWDLVSNVGGVFGLFLGLSFLSFVDIVQVIIEICFIICKSDRIN